MSGAKAGHKVHVSLNLEAIEGAKGVSTNCLSGGLASEDVITLCYEVGYQLGGVQGVLGSFDLAEYNPYVEDWHTGRMAATFFYYFALGLSKGLQ